MHDKGAAGLIYLIAMSFVVLVLVASAVLLLTAPALINRASDGLSHPRGFLRAVAIIELFAALFLMIPQTRIWGIGAAASVTIARVVILFACKRPQWTVPGLMVLGALVPVALAR